MCNTPQPLYNTVHYNTVLDITWVIAGLQMVIKDNCTIYSCYNTEWIANTEIGLDPNKLNNSVLKRFFMCFIELLDEIFLKDLENVDIKK